MFERLWNKLQVFFRWVSIWITRIIRFLTHDIWLLNEEDFSRFKGRLVKDAKTVENKDFPYMGVLGTNLKKGPKKWTDVSSQVVTDYQRKKEDEFVAELRKKYTFEVHQDVLDTVNNH